MLESLKRKFKSSGDSAASGGKAASTTADATRATQQSWLAQTKNWFANARQKMSFNPQPQALPGPVRQGPMGQAALAGVPTGAVPAPFVRQNAGRLEAGGASKQSVDRERHELFSGALGYKGSAPAPFVKTPNSRNLTGATPESPSTNPFSASLQSTKAGDSFPSTGQDFFPRSKRAARVHSADSTSSSIPGALPDSNKSPINPFADEFEIAENFSALPGSDAMSYSLRRSSPISQNAIDLNTLQTQGKLSPPTRYIPDDPSAPSLSTPQAGGKRAAEIAEMKQFSDGLNIPKDPAPAAPVPPKGTKDTAGENADLEIPPSKKGADADAKPNTEVGVDAKSSKFGTPAKVAAVGALGAAGYGLVSGGDDPNAAAEGPTAGEELNAALMAGGDPYVMGGDPYGMGSPVGVAGIPPESGGHGDFMTSPLSGAGKAGGGGGMGLSLGGSGTPVTLPSPAGLGGVPMSASTLPMTPNTTLSPMGGSVSPMGGAMSPMGGAMSPMGGAINPMGSPIGGGTFF